MFELMNFVFSLPFDHFCHLSCITTYISVHFLTFSKILYSSLINLQFDEEKMKLSTCDSILVFLNNIVVSGSLCAKNMLLLNSSSVVEGHHHLKATSAEKV